MSYINWVKAYKDVIESTCAIVTALAVVAGVGAVWFAYGSLKVASSALEESRKATIAQTVFNVQRFGFEFAKNSFGDKDFASYVGDGPDGLSDEHIRAVRRKFGFMLMAYGIIFFQREHGYLNDREWNLYIEDMCGTMTSSGADDYFEYSPLDRSKFDEKFKQIITDCRANSCPEESTHAKTSQHARRCPRGTVGACPDSRALHQQPSSAASWQYSRSRSGNPEGDVGLLRHGRKARIRHPDGCSG